MSAELIQFEFGGIIIPLLSKIGSEMRRMINAMNNILIGVLIWDAPSRSSFFFVFCAAVGERVAL
jgi:hypothetical protein